MKALANTCCLRFHLQRLNCALATGGIDLFSLYVLFSHFRPRDATRGNSFFQMSSYARANLRITNEKQKENSHEGITWSEMGKQNVQAKKVYYAKAIAKVANLT